ncbi:MAG: membrane fusion protein (multidrug efflux system) [Enterobacterales bacterium]|jgi:membrane fusion protein (multidrug efflux system)
MKKLLLPLSTVIFLLVLVAWIAGFFNEKIAPGLTTTTAEKINISELYTITSKKEQLYEPVAASINAKYATVISSRILARIESIPVRSGDFVKKGELLVQLEKNELNSKVLQAKENVKGIEARYNESKQNFERATDLYKKKLTSEFILDKSRADYQSLSAELTAAKQQLNQSKTSLTYATLLSPIDGRVVDRFAEPGNTAQPGNKLLTLYNPLSLRVEAQVREKLALTLKQGQKIQVELPSVDRVIEGEIEEIVPAANTGSRSFQIKASIAFKDDLLPGMYARVLIPAGTQNKLYVPKNRVARVGQLDFVWVVVDGNAQRRFVRLGTTADDGMIAIISGVKVGEQLVSAKNRF